MDKRYLTVINLNQTIYEYKIVKHKVKSNFKINIFIIFGLMLVILGGIKLSNIEKFNDVVNTAYYIQNPINPLYSDMGNIVFTGGLNIHRFKEKELSFISPITYNNFKVEDDGILFSPSNNPILKAPESGIISDIFYDNNKVKYIKIKHSKTTYSVISNIDIIGTNLGGIVNKGQTIGTIKQDSEIKFKIEVKGKPIKLNISGENVCIK